MSEELDGGPQRQSKFMRLLGGKKAAVDIAGAPSGAGGARPRLDINQANRELEQQFDTSVRMKFEGGGTKHRGSVLNQLGIKTIAPQAPVKMDTWQHRFGYHELGFLPRYAPLKFNGPHVGVIPSHIRKRVLAEPAVASLTPRPPGHTRSPLCIGPSVKFCIYRVPTFRPVLISLLVSS